MLQKGDTVQARKAFEQLIAEYPEQKELAAQAREKIPAPLKLLPPPWDDGEFLEFPLRLPTGRSGWNSRRCRRLGHPAAASAGRP
ncbi:MAG: hypothetical protein ACRD8O_22135 [Bryobacteraceae bacterium]